MEEIKGTRDVDKKERSEEAKIIASKKKVIKASILYQKMLLGELLEIKEKLDDHLD